MVSGFRSHLAQAVEGDIVLLAYSGHGSQELPGAEFAFGDAWGKIQNLVLFDAGHDATRDAFVTARQWNPASARDADAAVQTAIDKLKGPRPLDGFLEGEHIHLRAAAIGTRPPEVLPLQLHLGKELS